MSLTSVAGAATTPTSGPSSSPSHIVVELVSNAGSTPWWGAAVITGSFLLVAGFFTYLFAKKNETTKFMRETAARKNAEVAELGAELITSGNKVKDIALLALSHPLTEFMQVLVNQGKPAWDTFTLASNRFQLAYPRSMEGDFKRYLTTTMSLMLPPFEQPGQLHAIEEQAKASLALTNALRILQGREPIEAEIDKSTLIENTKQSTSVLIDEMVGEALKFKHASQKTRPEQRDGANHEEAVQQP
ncbi:hypothetical protein [Curtobacterium sp. PsM8]|uniref:hypothetical protein n=1 Tax=Curtobacterium sp. PsM8 TaxID=3030532 RepID=UPI00263BC7CA|nr:hypothetical protein [Curtobacterium sp. PsM8]MDN4647245.1 hypothetical protein [Curtobacterium sp. PsM8]